MFFPRHYKNTYEVGQAGHCASGTFFGQLGAEAIKGMTLSTAKKYLQDVCEKKRLGEGVAHGTGPWDGPIRIVAGTFASRFNLPVCRFLSPAFRVGSRRCIVFRKYRGCAGRTPQAKEFKATQAGERIKHVPMLHFIKTLWAAGRWAAWMHRQGRWPVKSCKVVLGLLRSSRRVHVLHDELPVATFSAGTLRPTRSSRTWMLRRCSWSTSRQRWVWL